VASCQRIAKESSSTQENFKNPLSLPAGRNKRRYVRNAGVKNLYQRGKGKIFYYVKDGKWISLRTRVRAEARRQLEHLRQQEIALKFLKKSGLLTHLLQANGFPPRNSGETFMPGDPPDPANPLTTQYSLAPSFAKSERPDFAELANDFVARVACKSSSTHRMWRTRNAALIKLLTTLEKFNQQDVTKLSAWEKLDRLSPSGVWMAYKETGAGNKLLTKTGARNAAGLVRFAMNAGYLKSGTASSFSWLEAVWRKQRAPFQSVVRHASIGCKIVMRIFQSEDAATPHRTFRGRSRHSRSRMRVPLSRYAEVLYFGTKRAEAIGVLGFVQESVHLDLYQCFGPFSIHRQRRFLFMMQPNSQYVLSRVSRKHRTIPRLFPEPDLLE
jgi:hypothetical protein